MVIFLWIISIVFVLWVADKHYEYRTRTHQNDLDLFKTDMNHQFSNFQSKYDKKLDRIKRNKLDKGEFLKFKRSIENKRKRNNSSSDSDSSSSDSVRISINSELSRNDRNSNDNNELSRNDRNSNDNNENPNEIRRRAWTSLSMAERAMRDDEKFDDE